MSDQTLSGTTKLQARMIYVLCAAGVSLTAWLVTMRSDVNVHERRITATENNVEHIDKAVTDIKTEYLVQVTKIAGQIDNIIYSIGLLRVEGAMNNPN